MNTLFPGDIPATASNPRRGSTAPERARTEALLARYPHLSPAEIEEVRHWFRRRASAADVALLASNSRLHPNYRAFRNRHLEAFSWWQKGVVAALATVPVALLGAALLGEV
jgi:hypothetical protein